MIAKTKKVTQGDAAERILQRYGKPMHYVGITDKAIAEESLEFKTETPYNSMNATLNNDKRRRFLRVEKGIYDLVTRLCDNTIFLTPEESDIENQKLKEKICELFIKKREGSYWDFKKKWHDNNANLLHDIICMANNLDNKEAYVIIGVDEENEYGIVDVSEDKNRKNTNMLIDFLRSKKFAGDNRPIVRVESICMNDKKIDVIVVEKSNNIPFYLTEEYPRKNKNNSEVGQGNSNGAKSRNVRANNIYVRVKDTNTHVDSSADFGHIEELWKTRFGISENQVPLEKIKFFLTSPENWKDLDEDVDGQSICASYYIFDANYVIETFENENKGYEIYLFNKLYDLENKYLDIKLKFNGIELEKLSGVSFDHNSYLAPGPGRGFIKKASSDGSYDDEVIGYRYYIEGSLEYNIYNFYLQRNESFGIDSEIRSMHDRFMECVLVFKTELERNKFHSYINQNLLSLESMCKEIIESSDFPDIPEIEGYKKSARKEQLAYAFALQEMLSFFDVKK